MTKKFKIPVQSLIDHIKTATDVDPWAKEMAEELLKEHDESIPVSWLTEKLEGHPELSYAVTDGINNVLELWEGR